MMESIIYVRNWIIRQVYAGLLKPRFFRYDPEEIHDSKTRLGRKLGRYTVTRWLVRMLLSYQHPALRQTIRGITFNNPVGLAAGFDKNGYLLDILPAVGFGFAEIGSITAQPCAGNPKPRLWRLQASKAIVVNYGLFNDGAETIYQRLSTHTQPRHIHQMPFGVSIAKTNCQATVDIQNGIADYAFSYELFQDVGDYITLNISCPNAFGGESFAEPQQLDMLLATLLKQPASKPIFLKMPAGLSGNTLDAIIALARKYKLDGFICTNLLKDRNNSGIVETELPAAGNISGKPVEKSSNAMIAHIYNTCGQEFTIIGCGGIFSAADAYTKIKLGASLLQLITGMIFEGPQLISEINQGLVRLLRNDGYTSISEAVGVDSNRSR